MPILRLVGRVERKRNPTEATRASDVDLDFANDMWFHVGFRPST